MSEHEEITGVTDISGDPFPMRLEDDGVYFEGGSLDLDGIGQLQVALDLAVTQIRKESDGA